MLVNEYMRNLPIINNLNAKLMHNSSNSSKDNKSSLGIYFLNQWIKTNSFLNKRSLELNNWLFEQIKQCSAPLHPIMISLINTYITQLFNVNVLEVNTHIPPRKTIRVGMSQGFKPTYKRAIITLKEGDSINYNISNVNK